MASATEQHLPILAACGNQGISLLQGKNGFGEVHTLFEEKANKGRLMMFSDDGSHFAFCNGEVLKVLNMETGETTFQIPKQKTQEMKFSPKNNFLAIWEPYYTTPQNPQGSNNFEIISLRTGEIVKSMIHKKQDNWMPHWTNDEKLCGRCVSNEVQFFSDGEFQKASTKLYLTGVANCSVSPSTNPYAVAAYVPGKKGSPSCVRLFQYPMFGEGQAIGNKSFFKADKVDMMWNKKGSALLVLVSAEVDTTGSTYYGEQSLHFMSMKGESSLVTFDKRGPIYSVDWNPNSSQFCVVYGYMPAKATLYNMKCEPVFDFGTGPRNVCLYNQHGNILCLAGFGNLSGFMEMWNVDGKKMICKLQSRDTTNFEWCPDGQHIVISTCAPRLRVSNGYKIWHYSGKELYKHDTPKNAELWKAVWQKFPDGSFPVPRIVSAGSVASEVKQAYRPPSARGTTVKKLNIHDNELPQNQRSGQENNLSAAALKNKKKREAKAKSKETNDGASTTTTTNNTTTTTNIVSTGDPEKDKKIKNLRKKLKAIEDLKAKQKEGKTLEKNQEKGTSQNVDLKNQLDKLKTENDLLKEMKALQV